MAKTLALAVAVFSSVAAATTVTLYDSPKFLGESSQLQIEPGSCKSVDLSFAQRVESAKWDAPLGTTGKIGFFETADCGGPTKWWNVDSNSYPSDFASDFASDNLANKVKSVKFEVEHVAEPPEWADDDGVHRAVEGNARVLPAPRKFRGHKSN